MNRESRARIYAVLWKEWLELRGNRGVMGPTLALPVLLTGAAIGAILTLFSHSSDIAGMLKGQDPRELLIQVGRQMVTLFLIMPCILPSTTAAHSIVGEKLSRSLEPVLATPVRTWELLCGKLILCLLLGVLPSWLSYGAFLAILKLRLPAEILRHLVTAPQLVLVSCIGPLLALFSVTATIIISSRLADAQAAQSVSVLVALPIIGIATSQAAGLVTLPLSAVFAAGFVLLLLDLGALRLCVALFARETILTRWK
jgi:ABC-2 type transport system permease protein